MRLVNTTSLALESFSNSNPDYAILSHTWSEGEEVTYQEMATPDRSQATQFKLGYHKIEMACKIAREEYKLQYLWVDTACIDKTSSAELSEAINTMYRWYEEAQVCISFLSDFLDDLDTFDISRWFRRGWTLQELIAPSTVAFYDWRWSFRGTRTILAERIHKITNVPIAVLEHEVPLSDIPIAARMAWASSRETTREEDMAYCLLGIFDINMPMLYGEGKKAFIRLQEEIIKQSADMSLFLWTDTETKQKFTGILAPSPSCFRNMAATTPEHLFVQNSYYISNRGIKFRHGLAWDGSDGLGVLSVNHGLWTTKSAGIYIRRAGQQFVRANPSLYVAVGKERYMNNLTVQTRVSEAHSLAIERNVLKVKYQSDFTIVRDQPPGCFDGSRGLVYAGYAGAFLGYVIFRTKHDNEFALIVSFRLGKWGCTILHNARFASIEENFYYNWGNVNLEQLNTQAWRDGWDLTGWYSESEAEEDGIIREMLGASFHPDPHDGSWKETDDFPNYITLRVLEDWEAAELENGFLTGESDNEEDGEESTDDGETYVIA